MVSTLSTLTAGSAAAQHWAGGWGFGFFPFVFFIPIFWIVVIGLIVFFATRRRRAYWREHGAFGDGNASRSAEVTLAERFAQGDIDEVEYRKRLEVLRANRPGPTAR